jgi:hypothetical protein
LDRVHNLVLLTEESITQVGGFPKLLVHHGEHLREMAERFHTHVPGCILESIVQPVPCEARILLEPPVSLDNFKGIGGRHKNLREERIRVEGNGGQQSVQLFLGINVLLYSACGLILRHRLGA